MLSLFVRLHEQHQYLVTSPARDTLVASGESPRTAMRYTGNTATAPKAKSSPGQRTVQSYDRAKILRAVNEWNVA